MSARKFSSIAGIVHNNIVNLSTRVGAMKTPVTRLGFKKTPVTREGVMKTPAMGVGILKTPVVEAAAADILCAREAAEVTVSNVAGGV